MVLTVEEKKQRLTESADWFTFTDQQKNFLVYCAEGLTFSEAVVKAYPKTAHNSKGGVRGTVGLLTSKPVIKDALASIGIGTKRPLKTREDILQVLSDGMDTAEDNDQLLKFINTFAKISGWDKDKGPAPDEEPSLEEMVAEAEKKRREKG